MVIEYMVPPPHRREMEPHCDILFSFSRLYIVTSVHHSTYSPNHETDSNARWLKRRGLGQGSALQASVFRNFHFLWVISLKNLQNFAVSAEIPAKTKMLNNFLLA